MAWFGLMCADSQQTIERPYGAPSLPEIDAPSYKRLLVDPCHIGEDGHYTIEATFEAQEPWTSVSALGLWTAEKGGELFYWKTFDLLNVPQSVAFNLKIRILGNWRTLLHGAGVLLCGLVVT